jgi:hypothetical protein
LVQQHWAEGADPSEASARSMYSPGSLNVAVVPAFPFSTVGVAFAKLTVPAPR